MILLGVDVIILAIVGVALTVASYVAARFAPMSQEEGIAYITATFVTASSMVIAYVVMARVLDMMLGAMGW